MSAGMAAAITLLGTLLINLIAAVFVYGGLTNRVNSHEKRLDGHERRMDGIDHENSEQWRDIAVNQSAVARIEGRLNGKAHHAGS